MKSNQRLHILLQGTIRSCGILEGCVSLQGSAIGNSAVNILKLLAHLSVASYAINPMESMPFLSLPAAGFSSCSVLVQSTVIYESTPK